MMTDELVNIGISKKACCRTNQVINWTNDDLSKQIPTGISIGRFLVEMPTIRIVKLWSNIYNYRQISTGTMSRLDTCLNCWYTHHPGSSFTSWVGLNSLRPRQNRRYFADDVFKCNFLNENVWIPIKISLKPVPKGPINNIPALVQIMAWRRTGDKPLSEPILTQFNDAYMRHSASMR